MAQKKNDATVPWFNSWRSALLGFLLASAGFYFISTSSLASSWHAVQVLGEQFGIPDTPRAFNEWLSNILSSSAWNLSAMLISALAGGVVAMMSWEALETSHRAKQWNTGSDDDKRRFSETPLPTHWKSVFLLAGLSALVGLSLTQVYGWGAIVASSGAIAFVAFIGFAFVLFSVADNVAPAPLPVQTQLGDAHWANWEQVQTRTTLLNGDD
jgi:predicted phage tail protein